VYHISCPANPVNKANLIALSTRNTVRGQKFEPGVPSSPHQNEQIYGQGLYYLVCSMHSTLIGKNLCVILLGVRWLIAKVLATRPSKRSNCCCNLVATRYFWHGPPTQFMQRALGSSLGAATFTAFASWLLNHSMSAGDLT
jgi:hypothetical protein